VGNSRGTARRDLIGSSGREWEVFEASSGRTQPPSPAVGGRGASCRSPSMGRMENGLWSEVSYSCFFLYERGTGLGQPCQDPMWNGVPEQMGGEVGRARVNITWAQGCERIDHTLDISIACLFIQELQS
jgi:hypothetical protein